MAKKKKGKKDAKASKVKLPKQIAGVKVGKELRHAVEPVMRWANHPAVSETLAAALVAGATALADGKGGPKKAKAGANAAVGDLTGGSRVGLALAVAAGEIAARIVDSYEQGARRPGRSKVVKRPRRA